LLEHPREGYFFLAGVFVVSLSRAQHFMSSRTAIGT
jgi:hypothetical protein